METERTISKLLETASGGGAVEEDFTLQEPKNISSDQLPRLLRSLETTTRHVTHLLFAASDFSDKRFSRETLAAILEAMERNRDHCCSKVRTLVVEDKLHRDQVAVLQLVADGLFPSLESLSLVVASRDEANLLDTILKRFPQLRLLKVRLGSSAIRNILSDNADFLKELTRLAVLSDNKSAENKEQLILCLPKLPALRSLSLAIHLVPKSVDLLARQLQVMTALTDLSVSVGNNPGRKETLELVNELRHLTLLESLSFSSEHKIRDLDLQTDIALVFASSLAQMSRMKLFSLHFQFTERSLLAISKQLHLLPDLTELKLDGKFSDEAVLRIGSALRTLTNLRILDLSGERYVTPPSMAPIAENMYCLTALEDLSLNYFDLDSGFRTTLSGQLRALTSLVSLSLNRSLLCDEVALSIADECGRLSRLRRLCLGFRRVDDTIKFELYKRSMPGRLLSHLEYLEVGRSDFISDSFQQFVKSYPLHFVTRCGDVTLVREVLASKVDANQIEIRTGESAIFYAARQGHDEVIRVLVQEGGARLDVMDKAGKGVVQHASPGSSTRALLEEMILTGADERPGEMIKGAAKRYQPAPPQD